MPPETVSTYLPTELLHLVMIINGIEFARRSTCSSPCEAKQAELFPYIRDVTFDRSLHDFVPGLTAARCGLDELILSLAQCGTEARLLLLDSGSELPPWIRVAFANSGEWGAVLAIDRRVVGVTPEWRQLSERERAKSGGQKVWDIAYQRNSATNGCEPMDMDAVISELLSSLSNTIELATQLERYKFVDVLGHAESVLKNDGPLSDYGGLLLSEECFQEDSRIVFEAAACSWVFGGRETWNDIAIDDPDLRVAFERITERLLSAVRNAIACAINDGRKAA